MYLKSDWQLWSVAYKKIYENFKPDRSKGKLTVIQMVKKFLSIYGQKSLLLCLRKSDIPSCPESVESNHTFMLWKSRKDSHILFWTYNSENRLEVLRKIDSGFPTTTLHALISPFVPHAPPILSYKAYYLAKSNKLRSHYDSLSSLLLHLLS
jgi:hypothetical protein